MDLVKLNQSESGRFFYNVLVGIVTTTIMDFSGNITNNLLIPLCMPISKELVLKLKGKKIFSIADFFLMYKIFKIFNNDKFYKTINKYLKNEN